jgi:uncharacterized protein (DUF983 family)
MAIQVLAILSNKCPRCLKGPVFRGLLTMNETCPNCGWTFEREPGYFLGALISGYFLSAFSVVPTLVLGHFVFGLDILPVVAIAVAQVVILQPLIYRYARLIWIHVEQNMTRNLDGR